jgi:hypothetical protein
MRIISTSTMHYTGHENPIQVEDHGLPPMPGRFWFEAHRAIRLEDNAVNPQLQGE